MKFPPRFAAYVALSLAVSTAACGTQPLDELRVVATVDRTTVPMNGTVTLTTIVDNASGQTVRGYSPDSYGMCLHAYRVFDSADRPVNVMESLCALMSLIGPRIVDLAPGGRFTIVDQWKPAESTIDGQRIPPGTYRVVPHYHAESRVLLGAPITVRVDP